MPSLLEGPLQKVTAAANRWNALDATITKKTGDYTPGTGRTVAASPTLVRQCVIPADDSERFRALAQLRSDERMMIFLQKPLRDLGVTLESGDRVTVRGVESEVVRAKADPAQGTWEAVVKP